MFVLAVLKYSRSHTPACSASVVPRLPSTAGVASISSILLCHQHEPSSQAPPGCPGLSLLASLTVSHCPPLSVAASLSVFSFGLAALGRFPRWPSLRRPGLRALPSPLPSRHDRLCTQPRGDLGSLQPQPSPSEVSGFGMWTKATFWKKGKQVWGLSTF